MASGFTGADTFTLPTDIGLELDSKGKLSLDTSTLNDALNEDYTSVLSLIGAMKTGTQTGSDAIKFYGSSERYTTAGTYDIRATVSGGEITSAQIKLSTESDSEWRDAEFDSGSDVVTGNTAFDDQGNPIYPENSLQFTVDTTTDGDYTSTMYIKRGFIGELDETLDDMLNTRYGRVPIAKKSAGTRIKNLNDDIETEQTRLASYEERLIQKYANLEKTLSLIQQQMGALNM
jgi:flagellar capping protein FliD